MSELSELMQMYVESYGLHHLEGSQDTAIPGVRFHRSTTGNRRSPFIYQSGIMIPWSREENYSSWFRICVVWAK